MVALVERSRYDLMEALERRCRPKDFFAVIPTVSILDLSQLSLLPALTQVILPPVPECVKIDDIIVRSPTPWLVESHDFLGIFKGQHYQSSIELLHHDRVVSIIGLSPYPNTTPVVLNALGRQPMKSRSPK